MPRTETYPLYLTKQEKDQLAFRAKIEGCSIAKLIRWKLGLDTKEEVPDAEKYFIGGKEVSKAERLAFDHGYRVGMDQHRRDRVAAWRALSARENRIKELVREKDERNLQ